ncbi:aspartic peptidase domain-containing protein, partial [Trametes maxima]
MLVSALSTPSSPAWDRKGKHRALDVRDDGHGGPDGIVIPLQLLHDSAYESVYVAPVLLGPGRTQFLLQVDTGSSDLWLASTSCSTSSCNAVGGHKYDSSQSLPTGQTTTLNYAEGQVDGPIVWDAVQFGGYSIDHQALIAASNVNDEPLNANFNGVLGLALPLNSVVAQKIPPTTSDAPDGASLSANLFGITPRTAAPPARFLSLALERPGSDKVASALGIGRHPASVVPDPSKIQYAAVVPEAAGSLFWQANVRAITVYVDNQPRPVGLPFSNTGTNGQPSVILDSGVPLIIASPRSRMAYTARWASAPPRTATPMNLSITLDTRGETPLHPLDLTYYPPNDPSSETCIGAIQTPDHIGITLTQADMILGVPFLRNAYTVLAYDAPAQNGSFPQNTGAASRIQPRLGILPLTDPATAAQEFYQ